MAYSTSYIWANIVLGPEHNEDAQGVREWLLRAKPSPLTLSLVDNSSSPSGPGKWVPLINSILPHCKRWRKLTCFINGADLGYLVKTLGMYGRMGLIQALLSVDLAHSGSLGSLVDITLPFTPNVNDIKITTRTRYSFPTHQMNSLRTLAVVVDQTEGGLSPYLQSFPFLEDLTIGVITDVTGPVTLCKDRVTHRSLRSLTWWSPMFTYHDLDKLELLALETLSLGFIPLGNEVCPLITSLALRSKVKLTSLMLASRRGPLEQQQWLGIEEIECFRPLGGLREMIYPLCTSSAALRNLAC